MSRYFDLLGFGFFCRFHSIQKDVTIVRKREEVGGGLLHWLEKVFLRVVVNGACLQIRRRTQLRRLRLPHFDFLNDREEK